MRLTHTLREHGVRVTAILPGAAGEVVLTRLTPTTANGTLRHGPGTGGDFE